MNSEELELSLRTEFESHLKNVVAEMRQEFSSFQEKVEAEFDKHKSQLDAVFLDFSTRLGTEKEFEQGFKETVVEHLRLARDEGARITAMAFAEAEELEKEIAPPLVSPPHQQSAPTVGLSELRDAINDITAQSSQATILKQLVHHAEQFTPRGAFFIIKNEHFVGWRVFGKEETGDDEAVREIFLPVASSTVLGESVRSLMATESSFGTYEDDSEYLDKLEFGQPDRMIAIPLVARGRGVAVLYADYGKHGEAVNVEALETLVRVAGLTVEVLASSQGVKAAQDSQPVVDYAEEAASVETQEEVSESKAEAAEDFQSAEQSEAAQPSEMFDSTVEQPDAQMIETGYQSEADSDDEDKQSAPTADNYPANAWDKAEEISETPAWSKADENEIIEVSESDIQELPDVDSQDDYVAPAENSYHPESPAFESVENLAAEKSFDSFESANGKAGNFVPEPAVSEAVSAPPVRSRFSDRNVDLPIEVGEDERRLHNDARRFARLLVSEIKLYNEQKVKEGRESQDLYERLREAIDRSRDMYDKRVQPPVAAKFDYFHYELVSTLAEGEENKLGGNYPGSVG